jgi:hypothetical protein
MVDYFLQCINAFLVFLFTTINKNVFKKDVPCEKGYLHCKMEFMMHSAKIVSNFPSSFKIRRTLE